MWALLLYVTSMYLELWGDVRPRWWATALVFAGIVLGSGMAWYSSMDKRRTDDLPFTQDATVALAWAIAPELVAGALASLGAAPFSLWLAFAASAAQFSWYAWRLHTRETVD